MIVHIVVVDWLLLQYRSSGSFFRLWGLSHIEVVG